MILNVAAVIFTVITAFYLLSLVRSILSILGIIVNAYDKVWLNPESHINPHGLSRVLVILPLYLEHKRDIELTLESIAKQDYPRDHMLIAIVVEEDDKKTIDEVERVLSKDNSVIGSIKDRIILLKKPPPRISKASAINYVVRRIQYGSIVCILDGGDLLPDRNHIRKAVSLINKGYSIVGSQVIRLGKGIIGKLSYLDTLIWVKIGLPSLVHLLKVPLVSGEGLFIKRELLEHMGLLPPKLLTEDAYLAIPTLNYGVKVGFLASEVYESTPVNTSNLIKQRLRWYRGHLQCLILALKSKGIGVIGKIKLVLAYSNPLVIASIFIAYLYLLLSITGFIPYTIPFLLSVAVVVSTYTAPLYILGIIPKDLRKVVPLLPFYWLFLSVTSVIALTLPLKIKWYKTLRSKHILQKP